MATDTLLLSKSRSRVIKSTYKKKNTFIISRCINSIGSFKLFYLFSFTFYRFTLYGIIVNFNVVLYFKLLRIIYLIT